MTSYIFGRNFPNRWDLLVEVAKVFDRALDRLDSGQAESEDFVLSRSGRDVRITLSKEQRPAAPSRESAISEALGR